MRWSTFCTSWILRNQMLFPRKDLPMWENRFPKKQRKTINFHQDQYKQKRISNKFSRSTIQNNKGPSINDVSSKGEGVKNVGIYLVKRRQRGREGDHKIGKNEPTSFMDGPLVIQPYWTIVHFYL